MPDQNPVRRFKLATKIEALSKATATICEHLGHADDATVLEALTRLEAEVSDTRLLAEIIADLAPEEAKLKAQQIAGRDDV